MSKTKLLKDKLEQALRYKNSHFDLIKDDNKTSLNRSDIYYLLTLLNKYE